MSDDGGSHSSFESALSEFADTPEREELRYMYQKAYADTRKPSDLDKILLLENKDRIMQVLESGSVEDAAKMLRLEKNPLGGLRRILRYMLREDLPTYHLRDESCEVVQAIQYCMWFTRPAHEALRSRVNALLVFMQHYITYTKTKQVWCLLDRTNLYQSTTASFQKIQTWNIP